MPRLDNRQPAAADPDRVLTMILAGGAGERLLPLTRDDAKPMVPFGGIYRLIDIPLSNCVNSQLRKIYILTQHKALSLNRHVRNTWNILPPELDEFIEVLPPTRRISDTWYLGTADAIYQNIESIEDGNLPYVLILSADHVYRMDYRHMLEAHIRSSADVTVATTQIEPCEAARFGIVRTDAEFSITGFQEKPKHDHPHRSCFNPEACSASMGIYLFSTPVLLRCPPPRRGGPHVHARFRQGRAALADRPPARRRVRFRGPRPRPAELLARRGHAGCLLRGQHGPGRDQPGLQPL